MSQQPDGYPVPPGETHPRQRPLLPPGASAYSRPPKPPPAPWQRRQRLGTWLIVGGVLSVAAGLLIEYGWYNKPVSQINGLSAGLDADGGRRRGGKPGTGLGPRSVRLTLGRLSAALEQACDDGKLARNPARGVKLPAEAKAERQQWTEDEVRRMLATEDRLAACWRLALYGLRRGEICGLRWADVDLDTAALTVAQTRVVVGQVVTKGPKSRASGRTLPLDAATVGEPRALKARQAAERLEAGVAYAASGYAACDEMGAPVSPEWFTDEFRRAAARAGLPRIRLHDSRRTINSLMASAGVPPHIRAAWCGRTVAVNEVSYTFAQAEDLALALGAVSKIHSAM